MFRKVPAGTFALLFCEVSFAQRIKCDLLSIRSETSVVIKEIGQHQVNEHVVLTFEKGRTFQD